MKFLVLIASLLATPVFATDIKVVTSKGGITAWLVEEHSIPIVSMDILFRGGASIEPVNKHGATLLMTGLLEEGAGDMDASEYLIATEELAAQFSFDAGRDSVSISATVLRESLDASMELLRLAMIEPRFDQVAFDRVRGQVESVIRADQTDARSLGGDRFRVLSFGEHPYARTLEGTLDSIASLTPDDMRSAHQNALVKSRVIIGVVGDITAEELGVLLDNLLSTLPENGPDLVGFTEMQAEGGVEIIDFPSPQSTAVFGHAGIARDDPDYLIAYVMNHILGTGFTSRLNQEVREKRGLTYGLASFLVPYNRAALYMGSVSSENAKIAEAMDVIRAQWRLMAEEGVTAEELDAAQKYLTGSYPLRFDSNGAIASIMAGLQFANLPLDYINTRNDLVNAVTVEDINRVAARLLQPDKLQVVIVGQPEGIEGY